MSDLRRVVGADPASLFRPGGKTLGDLMREVEVPKGLDYRLHKEFQLASVMNSDFDLRGYNTKVRPKKEPVLFSSCQRKFTAVSGGYLWPQ